MEECGHGSPVDVEGGTVFVVGGRVAAFGDPSRGEPVDVMFENRIVVVDEQIPTTIIDQSESSDNESCHLSPVDNVFGTEVGAATASSDPGFGHTVDVVFEDRVVVVAEIVLRCCRQVQGTVDESGHHLAGHWIVGTEQSIRRRVATFGDALLSRPLDIPLKQMTNNVDELNTEAGTSADPAAFHFADDARWCISGRVHDGYQTLRAQTRTPLE